MACTTIGKMTIDDILLSIVNMIDQYYIIYCTIVQLQ